MAQRPAPRLERADRTHVNCLSLKVSSSSVAQTEVELERRRGLRGKRRSHVQQFYLDFRVFPVGRVDQKVSASSAIKGVGSGNLAPDDSDSNTRGELVATRSMVHEETVGEQ